MSIGETRRTEPYRVPERFNTMTVHHIYGFSQVDPGESFLRWFARCRFGFLADLKVHDFSNEEIEAAVNDGFVNAAPWPKKEPSTDFFWTEVEGAHRPLQELAEQAVKLCGGKDAEDRVGNDFAGVGAVMGSQQLALAGLIYAREQGRLREISELAGPAGPLYVVRDSFSSQMFDILVPEET